MLSEAKFFSGLTGSSNDLRAAADALRASGQPFCLIGGLAVKQYAEPMVSLDADFAITAAGAEFAVEEFSHFINANSPDSRLRIQITVNSRHDNFPSRAVPGALFGVETPIGM